MSGGSTARQTGPRRRSTRRRACAGSLQQTLTLESATAVEGGVALDGGSHLRARNSSASTVPFGRQARVRCERG